MPMTKTAGTSTLSKAGDGNVAGAPPIWVIGLTAAGADQLSEDSIFLIHQADLLVGGQRHLSYFPNFTGETLPITSSIEAVIDAVQAAWRNGKRVTVLASGDPLFYGIGASLRRRLPADALEITPAPTSFQLAFAALAEPWHDAIFVSAHGRCLTNVVGQVRAATKAAILTDNQNTPAAIARRLMEAGLPGDNRCAICENMGSPQQRIIQSTLSVAAEETFACLNVFIVWNRPNSSHLASDYSIYPNQLSWLPDEAFATEGGQLTKREVRLLALAELRLQSNAIMWDIGAGSGSISVEAARATPTAQIYAIEKRQEFFVHLQNNLASHNVHNVEVHLGVAPDECHSWPDPDVVFVGGSGGRLEEIVLTAVKRLSLGGRLVVNLVTMENVTLIRRLLPAARINQIQINRGVPVVGMLRFEAQNPVFMIVWEKEQC